MERFDADGNIDSAGPYFNLLAVYARPEMRPESPAYFRGSLSGKRLSSHNFTFVTVTALATIISGTQFDPNPITYTTGLQNLYITSNYESPLLRRFNTTTGLWTETVI